MNVKELAETIGKTVNIRVEDFTIPVTIVDVKQSYGRTRYLVKPVSGAGIVWVEESRFRESV